MIDVIAKSFKELRGVVRKFYSGKKADPNTYIAKVQKWAGDFNEKIKDWEEPEEKEEKNEK